MQNWFNILKNFWWGGGRGGIQDQENIFGLDILLLIRPAVVFCFAVDWFIYKAVKKFATFLHMLCMQCMYKYRNIEK